MHILICRGRHPLYEDNDNTEIFLKKIENPKWNFSSNFTTFAKDIFEKLTMIDP